MECELKGLSPYNEIGGYNFSCKSWFDTINNLQKKNQKNFGWQNASEQFISIRDKLL